MWKHCKLTRRRSGRDFKCILAVLRAHKTCLVAAQKTWLFSLCWGGFPSFFVVGKCMQLCSMRNSLSILCNLSVTVLNQASVMAAADEHTPVKAFTLKIFLTDRTSRSMIGYWHHSLVCLSIRLSVTHCTVAKRYILQKSVATSEREALPRNTILQLTTN